MLKLYKETPPSPGPFVFKDRGCISLFIVLWGVLLPLGPVDRVTVEEKIETVIDNLDEKSFLMSRGGFFWNDI